MNDEIGHIINRIEDILRNSRNEPADILGSYIVGATLARNDIDQHYKKYPLLEKVAELGADLETLGGSEYAENVLNEIRATFDILKNQVRENSSE